MSGSFDTRKFIVFFEESPHSATNALFQHFFKRLMAFAFGITGHQAESEDIAIKAITAVHDELASGRRDIRDIANFLYVATRNASITFLRKSRNTANYQTIPITLSDQSRIEHEIERGEIMMELHKALQKLPDLQKEALILLFVEGLSYREAADRMGISVPMLKNYRRGGLMQLRQFGQNHRFVIPIAVLLPLLTSLNS